MLRTAVYVDGYNLYYGRLRGTPFKWFDLVRFVENLLQQRTQNEQLAFVHLFTAPALARFATHGQASVEAQSSYLRAHEKRYPNHFRVTYGKHSVDKNGTPLPTFKADEPFDKNDRTKVWLLEEKQTDVNLALTMYRDVAKGLCDRVILVSNDSDAEPALAAIKQDFPNIMLGVIQPIRPPQLTNGSRRASGSLARHADWVQGSISDSELQNAQLSALIPTNKKPILKPQYW